MVDQRNTMNGKPVLFRDAGSVLNNSPEFQKKLLCDGLVLNLGESSSAPYSMEWSPKAVGSTSLTARATDTAGASTDSSAVAVQLTPAFPYATGFEIADGFSDATLHGIYGWEVAAGSATISASGSYSGNQSVVLNASATVPVIEREFAANNAAVAFVDFFSKPVAGADVNSATSFDVDGARIAFVADGANGRLHVLNGDGQGGGSWVVLGSAIPLAGDGSAQAWTRISVRLDYSTKKWDLYLNGQMIAFDLRFRLDSASSFSWFSMKGAASASARLDAFYAGASNPLFTDINNDGLPDDRDRYGDLDGDGLSNILEYVLGTNPNNADTDGDDIPDGWEYAQGLSPLNPADAGLDSFKDGLTNLQVFRTGRDILNPSDGATIPPGIQVKLRVPTDTYYQVTTSTWAISPDAGP